MMLRLVLDTNIFVSSILTRQGTAAQLLNAWRDRQFLLVVSVDIIDEISAVLRRRRLREKYAITSEDVDQLIALFEHDALSVPGQADVAGAIPNDPADEKFLACAVDGMADYLVSGDKDLLELGEYQNIPIVTLRQVIDILEE